MNLSVKRIRTFFCYLTTVLLVLAQTGQFDQVAAAQSSNGTPSAPSPAKQTPPPAQTTAAPPAPNTLLDGTPVKLRLQRTISSADAHVGDSVDFDVLEEVKVDKIVVIPKGAIALATVTAAEPKKRMGRGGKLDVNIDSVRLADNEKAALRATEGGKAGGHVGAMTGAMVATGIVFFPAAPLFLFMHGKDITIPKGTEITAYINGDFPFDPIKIQGQGAAASTTASTAVKNQNSQLAIDANVPGCDIEVDGVFAGNTPSTLALAPGTYKITVSKKGYSPWIKTMMVTGSNARINAELETAQPSAGPSQ